MLAIALALAAIAFPTARAQDADPAQDELERVVRESTEAFNTGNYETAIQRLEELLVLDPENAVAAYNLACAHAQIGNPDDAVRWFEQSLDWDWPEWGAWALPLMDQDLDPIRDDPRFLALLDRLLEFFHVAVHEPRQALARQQAEFDRRQLFWRDGHTDWVFNVRFSPDGQDLLTCADDGQVIRWSANTIEPLAYLGVYSSAARHIDLRYNRNGDRVAILDRHVLQLSIWDPYGQQRITLIGDNDEHVVASTFSADGLQFIVGTTRGDLYFHDSESGQRLPRPPIRGALATARPQFESLGLSADGRWLVTNHGDSSVSLFDGSRRKRIRTWASPSTARLSRDQQRLLIVGHAEFAGRGSQRSNHRYSAAPVEIWDLTAPEPELLLETQSMLKLSEDPRWGRWMDDEGTRLITLEAEDSDALFRLWDVDDGTPILSLATGHHVVSDEERIVLLTTEQRDRAEAGREPERSAVKVALSADGGRLVTMMGPPGDVVVHIYDADSGEWNRGGYRFPHTGMLEFDPLGEWLALMSMGVSGSRRDVIRTTSETAWAFDSGWTVSAGDWAPDSSRFAAVGYPNLGIVQELWEGGESPLLSGASMLVRQIEAIPVPHPETGRSYVMCAHSHKYSEGALSLWDPNAPSPNLGTLATEGPLMGATVNRTGDRVAVFGDFGTWIHALDDLRLLHHISSPVTVLDVQLASEERVVVTKTFDGATAELWGTDPTGDREPWLIAGFPVQAWRTNVDSPVPALSPDGSEFAIATRDGGVEVRDVNEGALRHDLESDGGIRHVTYSPDGRWLLTSQMDSTLWSTETWSPVRRVRILAGAWTGAFDRTSTRFVLAGGNGDAHVCSIEPDSEPRVLEGHTGSLTQALFSDDGRFVLTTSTDMTARLWNADTGEPVRVFEGALGTVTDAVFLDDGRRLVTCSADSTARLYDVASGRLLQSHVVYEGGESISATANGYYQRSGEPGAQRADDFARIRVQGEFFPVSSYARSLERPDVVAAVMAGEPDPPLPPLPAAPDLILMSPRDPVLNTRTFDLEAQAEGVHDITSIRVEQDGVEIAASQLGPLQKTRRRNETRATLTVSLQFPPGRNQTEIRVRAENQRGVLSWPETLQLRYEPPTADLYLVGLGVQDYDDDQLDLRAPRNDVKQIVARMQQEEGNLYRKVHTRVLLDRDVNHGALNALIDEFLYEAGPEDTILVFVAGHGALSRTGRYFFLTSDATPDRPTRGIPRDQLYNLVQWEGIEARRRVLLIDSCHAGHDFGKPRDPDETGERGVGVTGPQDAFGQGEIDREAGSGLYIITGSQQFGVARETAEHGIFTAALLDGLTGKADQDGSRIIDIEEWLAHTREQVRAAEGVQKINTPSRVVGGDAFPIATVR